jgi:hypothetical protein
MKAVFTGIVSDSADQTNYFGRGTGGALDGLAYTLTFLYDPDTPTANRFTSALYDQVSGGTLFGSGVASPTQSAKLTIGGLSRNIDPSQYGSGLAFGNDYYQQVVQDTFDDGMSSSRYNFFSQIVYDASVVSDLEAPLSIATILLPAYGQFQFSNFDYGSGQYTYLVSGTLNATGLAVSQVSDVPVPAAFPMLAAGLGALSVIAKRRRKQQSA